MVLHNYVNSEVEVFMHMFLCRIFSIKPLVLHAYSWLEIELLGVNQGISWPAEINIFSLRSSTGSTTCNTSTELSCFNFQVLSDPLYPQASC